MTRTISIIAFLLIVPAKADADFLACSSIQAMEELNENMRDQEIFLPTMLQNDAGICWIDRRAPVEIPDARPVFQEDGQSIRKGPGFLQSHCQNVGCPLSNESAGYLEGTLDGSPVIVSIAAEFVFRVASTSNLIFRMYDECSPRRVDQVLMEHSRWRWRTEADYRRAQEHLAERGLYDGPIDGIFGPDSRTALAEWVNAGCR